MELQNLFAPISFIALLFQIYLPSPLARNLISTMLKILHIFPHGVP